jgi:hypothetical protein
VRLGQSALSRAEQDYSRNSNNYNNSNHNQSGHNSGSSNDRPSRNQSAQPAPQQRSNVSFANASNAYNAVSASTAAVVSQTALSNNSGARTPGSSRATNTNSNTGYYGSGGGGGDSHAAGYLSEVEQAILRSNVPLEINETEEITVLGQRGIWANRAEVTSWRGSIPIKEYVINEDANPEVITKRTQQRIE